MRQTAVTFSWVLLLCAAQGMAENTSPTDKSGVSPRSVSRPQGPGSLEGLGESFQPGLNTGTARYSVPFDLPAGPAGFKPAARLKYDNGFGQGPVGIGWALDIGSIRRQAEKGLPRYPEVSGSGSLPDRFLGMEDEELVSLVNGFYLAKIEGTYLRYRQLADHWEAYTKSGIKLEFGLTPDGRVTDGTGFRVAKWCLERQTDPNGNAIQYTYFKPITSDRQNYLQQIRWGAGSSPWTDSYTADFLYEPRSDAYTDYRTGFAVRTSQRLMGVEIKFNGNLIRRYELEYQAHPHWSFLTSVTQFGTSGNALPPTTFSYDVLNLCAANQTISAAGSVISSSSQLAQVMDNQAVDLIDLNADALPDILVTGSAHFAYINRGVTGGIIQWQGPVDVAAADPQAANFDLTQFGVHLSDMTGDGIADLVAADEFDVEFFPNTGDTGWAAGVLMQSGSAPPPRPFGPNSENVKTADLDFDKTIDVVQSNYLGYDVWLNLGGSSFGEPIHTDGARYFGDVIGLDTPGVSLADMNGDRLLDVVKITSTSVIYCPNMGYGQFDSHIEVPLPDRYIDVSPDGNLKRASLQDVNGDGLADLVVERATNDDLWVWINLGNDSFAHPCTITNLPVTANSAVRWADINGNGTTDLIYADSTLQGSKVNAVDVGLLLAGTAHTNLLRSIANGYGRLIAITYDSSTDYSVKATNDGNAWATKLPFPSAVVSKTETTFGLNLDGYLGNDTYLTEFSYRDGYYDPLEKQFRGFAFAKQIERGDERFGGSVTPTLVTRFGFHTGAPDGVDNDNDGQIDEAGFFTGREEEPLKGVELWRETTVLPDDPLDDGDFVTNSRVFSRVQAQWEVRYLSKAAGGRLADRLQAIAGNGTGYRTNDAYGREVRQAVRTQIDTYVSEQGETGPKQIRLQSDLDEFGNEIIEWKLGDVANACVSSGSCDDLYESTTYVLDANAVSGWMLDRVATVTQQMRGPTGSFVSGTRNYYDGSPLVGLPLGQIGTKGQLHRTEALVTTGAVEPLEARSYVRGDPRDPAGKVDVLRQELDTYGNPITLMDAKGNIRRLEYDSKLHAFPTREIIEIGGQNADLTVEATYDLRFGKPITLTDFNGHVSVFDYDEFGRLKDAYEPGDPFGRATHSYAYQLGSPVSGIQTTSRTNEGSSPDVVSTVYFDGGGRKLGVFDSAPGMFPGAAGVMHDVAHYDARGRAWKAFNPYAGAPLGGGGAWQQPPPATPFVESRYDATGRVVRTISQPDKNNQVAVSTRTYQPLRVIEADGEDNRVGGPHYNTPKTLVYDGLDRLIEVHEFETLSQDSGEFVTKYRYAMPDMLAEIEDANHNIKYIRYDALGRKIFMNDLNRGYMYYTYDAAGNLTRTKDAKNQEIIYAYDGANRLLSEDFLDTGTPLSFAAELNGRPDVVYHYDAPFPTFAHLANTKGELAWIEDLSGAEFRGYNARGAQETTIKRIKNLTGDPTTDYVTTTLVDNLDRVFQVIYHDGGVVRYDYDARGQLADIPNFADSITYTPSEQPSQLDFANGVVTTRSYDPRLRLSTLHTVSPAESIALQDLTYDYDQADNITAITDGRTLPGGQQARSQTASYIMDNLYRLKSAQGRYQAATLFTLNYDYDPLGSMTKALSPDTPDPDVNVGQMASGGALGTANRIGRGPADPPGPHALTATTGGSGPNRSFSYDANGNMTSNADDLYFFDFKDRLGKVEVGGSATPAIRYIYDYSGRRIIKRVDSDQTSYIDRFSEIRDGHLDKYVWNGDQRLAKVEGGIPDPPIVTQRISFAEGFNSFSFQVDPGTSDPATILADLAGGYIAIYAWDTTIAAWRRYPFDAGITAPLLTSLQPNRGYWIDTTEPSELIVEGLVSTAPVTVSADVQAFVGIPGLARRPISDLFDDAPAAWRLWAQENHASSPLVFDSTLPLELNTFDLAFPTQALRVITTDSDLITLNPSVAVTTEFYLADHIGSAAVLTNEVGALAAELANYPFGNPRIEVTATKHSAAKYIFAGKERDGETGLDYFGTRYYDTTTARLISVDPYFGSQNQSQVVSSNPIDYQLYCYAHNSPLSKVDPDGQKTTTVLDKSAKTITVHSDIKIYGAAASDKVAKKVKSLIERAYKGFKSKINGIEYNVKFDVQVTYDPKALGAYLTNNSDADIFEIKKGSSPLYRPGDPKGRSNETIGVGDRKAKQGTLFEQDLESAVAHEYGHVLGLPDQYNDSRNVMFGEFQIGDPGGRVEQKDVDAVLKNHVPEQGLIDGLLDRFRR